MNSAEDTFVLMFTEVHRFIKVLHYCQFAHASLHFLEMGGSNFQS